MLDPSIAGVLLVEKPKFRLLLGDCQSCVPARCSALPASARSCETVPGNAAFMYPVALPLRTWPGECGLSLPYRCLLVPAVDGWWCELWLGTRYKTAY